MREIDEDRLVFLRDGIVVDFEAKPTGKMKSHAILGVTQEEDLKWEPEFEYSFDILIPSSEEVKTKNQEFGVYLKERELYFVWESRNGQFMALPITDEVREKLLA